MGFEINTKNFFTAPPRLCGNIKASLGIAFVLLTLFIGWNRFQQDRYLHRNPDQTLTVEREHLPDTTGFVSRRLDLHDFESGNLSDPATHLALPGHGSRQSLKLIAGNPFSPGLWIRFGDLNPGDLSWIRVSGWVYFTNNPSEVKCYLVATCNQKGINFKYMYVDLAEEHLKAGEWNRVSIDYHIPKAPRPDDVLQAYFWFRGGEDILVDDIEIEYFVMK